MRQLISLKCLLLAGILLAAAPLYASEFIYQEDFENGLGGFVIDNTYGNGLWHLSTACQAALVGHSAATTLAYAIDASCTYDNDLTNQGVATSPGIFLPALANTPITLKVKYFLQTEGDPTYYDMASIEVSADSGPFIPIAHNNSAAAPITLADGSGVWQEMTADLTAYSGSSIRLRFGFNSMDYTLNNHAGFYVDDITIFAPLYYEDFESGLGGFVIDNNFGNGTGLWHLSKVCQSMLAGHSASTALAYAQDSTCNYNNGVTNQGVATSPGIVLSGSANAPIALKVRYYLETEEFWGLDVATVEVSKNGGLFSTLAYNGAGTLADGTGVWQELTADLTAYAGSVIQLRFGFNTGDNLENNYDGFYVDDITIYTPPVYHEDFEDGVDDWWIDNTYGNGNGLWHLSTVCQSTLTGHSAASTLAYADDNYCDFVANNLPNQGIAESPYIDLSAYPNGTIKLRLKYFLGTEIWPDVDIASIAVSADGGPFITLAVNSNGGAAPVTLEVNSGVWEEMTADLSAYAGSEIQLRFSFNSVDNINNFYAGFYVDDITIESLPCLFAIAGDVNGDCRVTLADFAMIAQNWLLDCLETPADPGCVLVY